MTVEIPLTQGQVAIVCDCHAHLVIGHKWHALYNPHTKSYYALRTDCSVPGKRTAIWMHRLITGAVKGEYVDHIKHNTLDNRCSELRICSFSENMRNSGKQKNNKTGYAGVFFHKRDRVFYAAIGVNGKDKYLGSFDNPVDAAVAYDNAAKLYFGEFANTNF